MTTGGRQSKPHDIIKPFPMTLTTAQKLLNFRRNLALTSQTMAILREAFTRDDVLLSTV